MCVCVCAYVGLVCGPVRGDTQEKKEARRTVTLAALTHGTAPAPALKKMNGQVSLSAPCLPCSLSRSLFLSPSLALPPSRSLLFLSLYRYLRYICIHVYMYICIYVYIYIMMYNNI